MKKTLLFLLIFSTSHLFSQNSIDWISLEKAKEKAKISNKKILIYFYKKDCKYCIEMKKETLEEKEVVSFINNNFHAVKIDSRTKEIIEYKEKREEWEERRKRKEDKEQRKERRSREERKENVRKDMKGKSEQKRKPAKDRRDTRREKKVEWS